MLSILGPSLASTLTLTPTTLTLTLTLTLTHSHSQVSAFEAVVQLLDAGSRLDKQQGGR